MRRSYPFRADDLESLDLLYGSVGAVIPMRDVYEGDLDSDVIAVRHDVDDNAGSWQAALSFAQWEYDRGYRTTYFLLHTASYWGQEGFWDWARQIQDLGHEVGLHANCLAQAIRTGRDPSVLLVLALAELRAEGLHVDGVVAHGDELCRDRDGGYRFVNDEMFVECVRPEMGAPDRIIKGTGLRLNPRPLSDYGLLYDSNRLPRKFYASDSGGTWNQPWAETVAQVESCQGQMHLLIHPDWWTEAF